MVAAFPVPFLAKFPTPSEHGIPIPCSERSGNWFCPSGGSCIHGKPDDQHNLQLDTANLGNAVAKSRTSLDAAVAS